MGLPYMPTVTLETIPNVAKYGSAILVSGYRLTIYGRLFCSCGFLDPGPVWIHSVNGFHGHSAQRHTGALLLSRHPLPAFAERLVEMRSGQIAS